MSAALPSPRSEARSPAGAAARLGGWLGLALTVLTVGCGQAPPPGSGGVSAPTAELVFYDWAEDIPQRVLDEFTRETGVRVLYLTYEGPEEAYANLRAGRTYDLAVVESRMVPTLAREGLLAELDHAMLPNLRNLAANFRDLAYDPGNRYSIPFNWGTTGLVYRSDLVAEPVRRWADLWDPRYAGRVGLWLEMPREVIAIALKALGHAANSEDPAQLEAALVRLLALKPHVLRLEDFDPVVNAGVLASGEAVLAMGFAGDALAGRERHPAIVYVLPEEGVLLWGDNFVIPAKGSNRRAAHALLDFLLRPEIAARIANENRYAVANEAALPLIDPEVRTDPLVFPPAQDLLNGEPILPLSPAGEELYAEIWARFNRSDGEGLQ